MTHKKDEFKQFLQDIDVFDDFCKDLHHHKKLSFDTFFMEMPRVLSHPRYYVEEAFPWKRSITNDYDFWYSVHGRWKDHLNKLEDQN